MSQEDAHALFLEVLHQLAPGVTERQVEQFFLYRQELLEWNARFNLTAITDQEGVLVKHFLDSLALLSVYDLSLIHI